MTNNKKAYNDYSDFRCNLFHIRLNNFQFLFHMLYFDKIRCIVLNNVVHTIQEYILQKINSEMYIKGSLMLTNV